MHKRIIILTKAEDREDALANVETFLEQYQYDVWDWYAIGNRWHNALAPKEKLDAFNNWIKEEYKHVFKDGFNNPNKLEKDGNREKIQAMWNEFGLTGTNPFYGGFSIEDTEDDYNVVPLNTCLETVKEWLKDLSKEKEIIWNKMLKAKKEEEDGVVKYGMSGYYAKKYSEYHYENFNEDSNVFNADTYEAEKLPNEDEINEYWAVMVDIHY